MFSGGTALLLAVAGMAVVVETVRPEWRDPEYGDRLKQVRAWRDSRTAGRPLVVVVGSSRVTSGFSPAHLGFGYTPTSPLVYNFAHTSYGPAGELLATRRLLDSGVVPDHLLIEVMSPFLGGDGVPESMIRPDQTGYADLRRLAPYRSDPGKATRAWAAARLSSWSSLRFSLLCHAGAESWIVGINPASMGKGMQVGGWTPPPRSVAPEYRAARLEWTRGGYAHFFVDFRIHPVQDRIYRDLLDVCRARGIRAAFFLMPESPAFRSWYPPGGRERVREYLAGLTREYGPPVFDASEWLPDEALFMDGHHLLYPAAEQFSGRFGRECLGPWISAGGR
ncbi:MAG: hypothetical protein JWO38_3279 [Gemmataceae bacterium]|nr:hypothetical protein [Gemmataceae bacterium]